MKIGLIGALVFVLAMIALTAIASWLYKGDPEGKAMFGLSLIFTVPISAVVGFVLGCFLS